MYYNLIKVFSPKAVSEGDTPSLHVLMQINLLMDLTDSPFMCVTMPHFPVSRLS